VWKYSQLSDNSNKPPNKSGRDCTEGSIPRHLLAVAMPMLIGNVIQSGYTIVDAIWVGRFAGKAALGAIAVSFPVLFIFIAVAAGATMATTILISQYYGAKNYELVRKTIGTSFIMAILLSVIISVAGTFSAAGVLRIMGTPDTVLNVASRYLRIHFMGFGIMYFSYLIASILRGIGDSKTPLYFMIIGAIINAVLDPLLIIGVGPLPELGLNGAAIATVIGQSSVLIIGYVYLLKKGNIVAVRLRDVVWHSAIAKMILKIGFPSMLQQSAVSLGIATVASVVNSFGESAIAAFGATSRIDTVSFFPAMSIGMAVSIIVGQNIGAGKHERVPVTFRWGITLTVALSLFITIFYLVIPQILLSAFITEKEVVHIGVNYLRIVGPGILMFAVALVANGVINGAGHTKVTLVFTVLALWGIRIPAILLLSKGSLGINGIWVGTVIGFSASMLLGLLWYFSGRWKKNVISSESAS
jgi:putative MATE family efflux protein